MISQVSTCVHTSERTLFIAFDYRYSWSNAFSIFPLISLKIPLLPNQKYCLIEVLPWDLGKINHEPTQMQVLKKTWRKIKRHPYLSLLWLFSGLETMLSFMVWFIAPATAENGCCLCDGDCINQFWWQCSQARAGMVGDGTEEVTKVGELKPQRRRKDEGTRESKGSFKKE